MAEEPIIAGSMDTIIGTIYDNQNGTLLPVDLTGAVLELWTRINGGTAVKLTPTANGDQVGHKGQYSYALKATDLPSPGTLEMQMHVSIGITEYKSKMVQRAIQASL